MQRAIIIKGKGEAVLVDNHPIPSLRPDYILVKVAAVALNPTDWKHIDWWPSPGALVGCDYAGTVVSIGHQVTNDLKPGDRVCGFAHGANAVNHVDGTFAEYIVVKGDIQMKIPSHMSFEAAATLGVGICTVGNGLFQSLKLPVPSAETPSTQKPGLAVLIYGGSTATGTLAIQFAKLAGLEVYTTCSPHSFELVKSLGAAHAFDYRSETCGEDIRHTSNNRIAHVFDCVSEDQSISICAAAMGKDVQNPKYSSLLPVSDFPRSDVETEVTFAYTVIGEEYEMRRIRTIAAKPEDFEFGVKFWKLTHDLLSQGKLQAHPVLERSGRLSGVLDGLNEMREGKVRASKLVYRIS